MRFHLEKERNGKGYVDIAKRKIREATWYSFTWIQFYFLVDSNTFKPKHCFYRDPISMKMRMDTRK